MRSASVPRSEGRVKTSNTVPNRPLISMPATSEPSSQTVTGRGAQWSGVDAMGQVTGMAVAAEACFCDPLRDRSLQPGQVLVDVRSRSQAGDITIAAVLDHLSIQCANPAASIEFYDTVLATLGGEQVMRFGDVSRVRRRWPSDVLDRSLDDG